MFTEEREAAFARLKDVQEPFVALCMVLAEDKNAGVRAQLAPVWDYVRAHVDHESLAFERAMGWSQSAAKSDGERG